MAVSRSTRSQNADEYRFALLGVLGNGAYGKVYKALDHKTKQLVAIKMSKKRFQESDIFDQIEAECLGAMNHPNVIHLEASFMYDGRLNLVMECMECNLRDFLRSRTEFLQHYEARDLARQLLQGLAYIHEKGYFHRDLTPANLLLKKGLSIDLKIADFGMARNKSSRAPLEFGVTTLHYRAPEVLLQSPYYDEAIDMWSAGVIIAEMFSLRPLFCGENEEQQLEKICNILGCPNMEEWEEGLKLAHLVGFEFSHLWPKEKLCELLPTATSGAVQLICRLLSWNPSHRPTAAQALQHPFFHLPTGC